MLSKTLSLLTLSNLLELFMSKTSKFILVTPLGSKLKI